MFALFYSLYLSMFTGTWQLYTYYDLFNSASVDNQKLTGVISEIGKLLTNMFNNTTTPVTDFGTKLISDAGLSLVAFVLALITSIGIVVMAVKGIKRVFSIFFMPIR